MKFVINIITGIFFVIGFSACPLLDDYEIGEPMDVFFINNSDGIIYVSSWISATGDDLDMDIINYEENEYLMNKCLSRDTIKCSKLYNHQIKDCFYEVIVISQRTLDSYSKEEIIEKNIYDKKYVLRCSALERMGFKIVYRGNEDRRH